ncbi:MAG: ABC transporter ATP-binding protein [Campylobacterota bacterium]|nr:ABC transporter ATP-binding protein [Campylobacterota bacterium]
MKETFKRYLPYIKDYKLQYFIVFIGIILIVSATAATAQIMQPLIDDMFVNRDEDMLHIIPIAIIGIYSVKSLGRYLQSVFMSYIGTHIVTRLREDLLRKIMFLDMDFLYKNRSGELISRVTGDISRIQYFVSSMLPELFREILTVIALIGYVIYLNAMLSFYALVVLPILIYPLMLIAKRLKRLSHRSQEKNADVVVRLIEVFNNNEVVKANASEEYELKRFSLENWLSFKIGMKGVYTNELTSPILELVASFGIAAVVYIGAQEVYSDRMTVGEFTAFLTAVGLVFQPVRRIGSIYGKIQDALAASERIFYIFDLEPKIIDGEKTLKDDIKRVEFKDVNLNYDGKDALKNINFQANSSDTIALVGDSGGGKSSLINLIIRFYDVSSGELNINGENIKLFSQHSLRDHVSIVSQRVYIFQDTLAANVAYGHEIDRDKVIEALRHADAYEFAENLENGIDTLMQEAGTNLSGGQRQRIAIARAIYKHSSVLILDEATSALDNKSEKRIQKALVEYTKDKITFIIAHRLTTIEHASKILVFKDGEIVDIGTHTELLEHSSEYKRLSGKML